MFVYTIQPVVNPVWQPVISCIRTFNQLSNPFDNRFDNRLLTTGCIVYTAGFCQTGCTTRFDNRLNEQWLFVQHVRLSNRVWQLVERTVAVRSTQLSNWLSNRVVQPVWQPVVSCKLGISRQQISSASGLKFTILWEHIGETLLFNNFSQLSIHAFVAKI